MSAAVSGYNKHGQPYVICRTGHIVVSIVARDECACGGLVLMFRCRLRRGARLCGERQAVVVRSHSTKCGQEKPDGR